jgi:hypothetical protein
MDNYYVSKLILLLAEARLSVVANPLINITLQGRHRQSRYGSGPRWLRHRAEVQRRSRHPASRRSHRRHSPPSEVMGDDGFIRISD